MNLMQRIHAVQAATETDTPFRHATNMEDPIATIRNLATALCLLSETMEETHGLVVQELARTIGDWLENSMRSITTFSTCTIPVRPLREV